MDSMEWGQYSGFSFKEAKIRIYVCVADDITLLIWILKHIARTRLPRWFNGGFGLYCSSVISPDNTLEQLEEIGTCPLGHTLARTTACRVRTQAL